MILIVPWIYHKVIRTSLLDFLLARIQLEVF